MKKKYFKVLLLSLIILTGACSKDFLENHPTGSLNESVPFTSTQNAMSLLNGIHRMMYSGVSPWNQGFTGQGSVEIYNDMMGEDVVMTAAGNGWYNNTYKWVDHRNFNSSQTYEVYRFYYKIINNANALITNVDNIPGADPVKTDAEKKVLKGQALVYRAWAHFNLVQLYGKRYDATAKPNAELGVPLKTTVGYSSQARATVEEVYTQINKDLDDAISILTTKRDNKSHINLAVAKGLKARVALTQQDWATAAKYAAEARTDFPLMSQADYVKGFNDYNNSEWMWGITVIPDQTLDFGHFFAYMSCNYSSTNIRNNPKAINSKLYNLISATDVRKKLWDPTGKAYTFLPGNFVKKPYMNCKFIAAGPADSRGDMVWMRAAEMYLIEAEAKANLGDATANDILFELMKSRDASAVKPAETGAALLPTIYIQRRIELWGEGFRFLDLKRLNQPLDRTGANHNTSLAGNIMSNPIGDNNWQYLFPKTETDANKDLKQNPY